MQFLSVDIGTGTQDIFLLRTGLSVENGFKLVMPSPTMLIRNRIQAATARGEAILLSGVTMGGGPSHWAAEEHLKADLPMYATPTAAQSFNDDLDWIRKEMGIEILSEDEAKSLKKATPIELRDFDFDAIRKAFQAFDVELAPEALALAVFDHGAAPPEISDRRFRFDYLEKTVRQDNRLSTFAYAVEHIPSSMTRMQAVASSAATVDAELVVMDTAPAAVLGATLDPIVHAQQINLILNIGNFHTLAFHLDGTEIQGLFEHHTGLLDRTRLEDWITDLAQGEISNEAVFQDQGHGAMVIGREPYPLDKQDPGLTITGPRRSMMRGSSLRPYFAVPFGDVMLSGCFGLLLAAADILETWRAEILDTLTGLDDHTPPWELET
jgi:uncharacterized protein (DUF1786 family)